MLPSVSCNMNRPTRVPASTVVRMNSASNMMAKWYQNALSEAPPSTPEKMCAIPTASVGAPPVRPSRLDSCTSLAAAASSAGVIWKPSVATYWAAASGVAPSADSGVLMAKYRPGSSAHAAMSAMTATNDSMSIEPYPMSRTCDSFCTIFGVVPEDTSAWKPESAPQAIVMNTNGNSLPANTGPAPL